MSKLMPFSLIVTILTVQLLSLCNGDCLNVEPNNLSGNCKCFKDPKHGNLVEIQCSTTPLSTLQSDFAKILNGGELAHSLQVRESNLNGIEQFPEHLFELTSLKFENVNISQYVLKDLIRPLEYLKDLVFDRDNLTRLTSDFFEFNKLEKITLNAVNLELIDDDAFNHVTDSLKWLRFRENRLTSLPSALRHLKEVEVVDLTGNVIKTVTDNEFENFKNAFVVIKSLNMDYLNCSCEQIKGNFVTFVKKQQLGMVLCSSGLPVTQTIEKDICGSAFQSLASILLISFTSLVVLFLKY